MESSGSRPEAPSTHTSHSPSQTRTVQVQETHTSSISASPSFELFTAAQGPLSVAPGTAPDQTLKDGNAQQARAPVGITNTTTSLDSEVRSRSSKQRQDGDKSVPNQDLGQIDRVHLLGDGRIRNPVPSKLQHKLNDREGNFSVMHMDVKKPVLDARALAAKRTSELTQAAAAEATKNGYQSVKRSKLLWIPPALESKDEARFIVARPTPTQNSTVSPGSHTETSPGLPLVPASRPGPSTHFVKSEQHRLLTLLRSLHPTLVVDQLCRALNYFGGVPDAPLAPNQGFPESDKMNGSGGNFIGWLAEIFPPMDLSNLPQPSLAAIQTFQKPLQQVSSPEVDKNGIKSAGLASEGPANGLERDIVTPLKRRRGRPKGSKSSKARKDKGIKKSERVTAALSTDDTDKSLPPSQLPPLSQNGGFLSTSALTHSSRIEEEPSPASTPSGKKRGRPKGSRNRPKSNDVDGTANVRPSSSNWINGAPPANESEGSREALTRPTSTLTLTPVEATGNDDARHKSPVSLSQSQSHSVNPTQPSVTVNLGSRTALSQHAQHWAGIDTSQRVSSTDLGYTTSPSQKRKSSEQHSKDLESSSNYQPDQTQFPNLISPAITPNSSFQTLDGVENAKRRRLSQGQGQQLAASNTHSSSAPDTSSVVGAPTSAARTTSSVTNQSIEFSPQASRLGQPSLQRDGPQQLGHQMLNQRGPWTQQQQQQFLHMQQQRQQRRAQQAARTAANLHIRNESLTRSVQLTAPEPASSQSSVLDEQAGHSLSAQELHRFAPREGNARTAATVTASSSSSGMNPTNFSDFSNDPAFLGMQYALGAARAVRPEHDPRGSQLGGDDVQAIVASQSRPGAPNGVFGNFHRQA